MLTIKNLSVTYNGNIKALKNINIHVPYGKIVVLIGANGAGKTTLLRSLSGLVKVEDGSEAILNQTKLTDKRTLNRFLGRDYTDYFLSIYQKSDIVVNKLLGSLTDEELAKECGLNVKKLAKVRNKYKEFTNCDVFKLKPHDRVFYGIAHCPEGRQVFANLTVQENLEMGAYRRRNSLKIKEDLEDIFNRFPRLKERRKQKAGTLSGGEQQMLAMARALMSKPKLIILDEPSMGLSPIFVNEIFDIIKSLHESGITILLNEQNAKKALSIADYAYVLETGKIVLEGKGSELLNNEEVKKAYLGA